MPSMLNVVLARIGDRTIAIISGESLLNFHPAAATSPQDTVMTCTLLKHPKPLKAYSVLLLLLGILGSLFPFPQPVP